VEVVVERDAWKRLQEAMIEEDGVHLPGDTGRGTK